MDVIKEDVSLIKDFISQYIDNHTNAEEQNYKIPNIELLNMASDCANQINRKAEIAINNTADLPIIIYRGVVSLKELSIDTPEGFLPVPENKEVFIVRLTTAVILILNGLSPISYLSENSGELFVNIVTIPGEGFASEKSTQSLRGHTDAVSFPFPGDTDPEFTHIAPSPDTVGLSCLRNPDSIPTTICPLEDILALLEPHHKKELLEGQFSLRCQFTFKHGTKINLGERHYALDQVILKSTDNNGEVIRYSHSNIAADEDNKPAEAAIQRVKDIVSKSLSSIMLQPGDIALINNRKALHGRAAVGTETSGKSRWLLRSYGLAPEHIRDKNRVADSPYKLHP